MIIRITTNLLESSLYIFTASSLVYLLWGNKSQKLVLVLCCVALGIINRVDFVILPIIFSLGALISKRIKFWDFVRINLVVFLTAGFYLLHNYIVFGHLLQRSAQVKSFLSQIDGPSSIRVFYLNVNLFLPYIWNEIARNVFKVFIFFLLFSIILSARKFKRVARFSSEQFGLLLTSLLSYILYFMLYRFNSAGLQPWYAANFLIVGSIVIVGVIAIFPNRIYRLGISISLSLMFVFSLPISFAHIWPNQIMLKQASNFMDDKYPGITYAAWNSGILSYNSDVDVTNLDGLVNDGIYSYVTNYRTFDFIRDKDIKFIVDFDETLNEIYFEPKGSRDLRWRKCISLVDVISRVESGEAISLYQVQPRCG
jgi:hypothetical protein